MEISIIEEISSSKTLQAISPCLVFFSQKPIFFK